MSKEVIDTSDKPFLLPVVYQMDMVAVWVQRTRVFVDVVDVVVHGHPHVSEVLLPVLSRSCRRHIVHVVLN